MRAWVDTTGDLSGMEPSDDDWFTRDALAKSLRELLCEVGRVYAPFMLANARALAKGSDRVECTIDGRVWTQRPFPYQGKCLGWLRRDYATLDSPARAAVDAALCGTGCETLFAQ